ncbi:MAG: cytidine deaminase [Desulfurococcales archaeon]|nr:cytidine deaminase [Desulfurococcales archaeon]
MQGVPRDLLEAARRVIGNAYAPYSGFRVAAAVRGGSGRVYIGVNVENASYGLTICAERAAVAAAVAAGERSIGEVLILSEAEEPIPPCGACRQVLAEFAGPETPVYSVSLATGKSAVWTLGELLPFAFKLNVNRGPGEPAGKAGGDA